MIQMRTKTTSSRSLMKSFDYILKARIEYVDILHYTGCSEARLL